MDREQAPITTNDEIHGQSRDQTSGSPGTDNPPVHESSNAPAMPPISNEVGTDTASTEQEVSSDDAQQQPSQQPTTDQQQEQKENVRELAREAAVIASSPSIMASEVSVQPEGGDDIGQSGPNAANGGLEAEAPAAPKQPRPKKEGRKIPRYESASIDEEEFQDCKCPHSSFKNRPSPYFCHYVDINTSY